MSAGRCLCSDLVVLERVSGPSIVNLEEIGEHGAVLESEFPFDLREQLCLNGGAARFQGFVKSVDRHEFGWRIEIEFSPLTPWKLELFTPKHFFDPAMLEKSAKLE